MTAPAGLCGMILHLGTIRRLCQFRRVRDHRATAIMEFALAAPALLYFLAAASDYGMGWWDAGCLANAVAQGAYYAFLNGPSVNQTAVKTLVKTASSLSIPTANITVGDPTQCYCPSGFPATLGTAVANCSTTCADGTAAGNYMTITATYTLTGFFPIGGLSLIGKTIRESVTVRLK
jgi:Flp pilus assembly protein TadG